MGDKSLQKRKYILEKAREVFHNSGYSAVTMKDIVDTCGISRGGLYIYFSSTKELFEAILDEEEIKISAILETERAQKATPGENMLMYLNAQKSEILKKKDNLTAAINEYMFINKEDNLLKNIFDEEVAALEELISKGVEEEWMVCDNPKQAAKTIMYAIEGMKIRNQTVGLSSRDLDNEIEYLMGTLGMVLE